jgi:hypothetical protein
MNMIRYAFCAAMLVLIGECTAQTPPPKPAIFEFHSGFWINLHQFLCHEAKVTDAAASDSQEWREAVDYYRRNVADRDVLSDESAALNNRLSAAGSADDLPRDGFDAGVAAALTKAAPVYRRVWWPQHNRSNRAWIDAVQPLLEKHGAAMQKDVVAAYGVTWPAAPIRTDVAAYAGPVGAYTTVDPAHITISSTDPHYGGNAALEMLFHESSHTLDAKIRSALTAELQAQGKLFRRRGFDHAIIFYTAGEIARRYLPGYEPYGIRNGVLERGWAGSLEVLEKDWKPYLDGRTDLTAAVRAAVADYGVARSAK